MHIYHYNEYIKYNYAYPTFVYLARVFSRGERGKGGNLPPLDCCLPPLQIGSNNSNSVLYFTKDKTPLPLASMPIFPPFKISLEDTLH